MNPDFYTWLGVACAAAISIGFLLQGAAVLIRASKRSSYRSLLSQIEEAYSQIDKEYGPDLDEHYVRVSVLRGCLSSLAARYSPNIQEIKVMEEIHQHNSGVINCELD